MGTGRSANFTRDQFTSDPLRVNFLSRNIKRNLLYQTSYLILCLHENTTVYLDVIENPVKYQKLLWNVSEERQKTEGIVYERIRPSIPKSSCLNKSQTHVSNYYKFQLSSDIEKNPGPTRLYIDPSKTITALHSQANELVFGQNSGQQCIAKSLCSLIYKNKQGINSANDLVSIMNNRNQLYSILSQLTKKLFITWRALLKKRILTRDA